MKKNNRNDKDLFNSAIIKLEKKHMIDRIIEKSKEQDLTRDEMILLIETIYSNYKKKREKMLKKFKLSLRKSDEIDRVSFYILDAIDNAITKEDKESINIMIKQNNLFNKYYDVIMNRNRKEEIPDIEYDIRKNNELIINK